MAAEIPLMMQTVYAELLDRARADAFTRDFADDGVFVPKTARGRVYWYFQLSSAEGRRQKYAGPETADLLSRIAEHKAAKIYHRDQRSLVAMLVRVAGLPAPRRDIGELIAALVKAGVFRLRGVLVGTVAYQTYSAMLGVRLPAALVQTSDIDVAQDVNVSAAVTDVTTPLSDVLRQVDASFRPVPRIHSTRAVTYANEHGLRVDFLTPNRGRDTDEPRALPAFGVDAQSLRFLDFLIRDPEPAVLLHGTGVLVTVPAPQRYALHKLIVARRRHEESGKRNKDLLQAEALLGALVDRRPHELKDAWSEAFARGKRWRQLIGEGLGLLHPATRDGVLRTVGATREVIPDLKLQLVPDRYVYDNHLDSICFFAQAGNEGISVTFTRDGMAAVASASTLDRRDVLATFLQNRTQIELIVAAKYLRQAIDRSGQITITRADVAALTRH